MKTPGGKSITLEVASSDTTETVKAKVAAKERRFRTAEQRLSFGGRQLEDGVPLSAYDIRQGSTLHLTLRLPGGGPGPTEVTSRTWPSQTRLLILAPRPADAARGQHSPRQHDTKHGCPSMVYGWHGVALGRRPGEFFAILAGAGGNKIRTLGPFATEEEAGRAYDRHVQTADPTGKANYDSNNDRTNTAQPRRGVVVYDGGTYGVRDINYYRGKERVRVQSRVHSEGKGAHASKAHVFSTQEAAAARYDELLDEHRRCRWTRSGSGRSCRCVECVAAQASARGGRGRRRSSPAPTTPPSDDEAIRESPPRKRRAADREKPSDPAPSSGRPAAAAVQPARLPRQPPRARAASPATAGRPDEPTERGLGGGESEEGGQPRVATQAQRPPPTSRAATPQPSDLMDTDAGQSTSTVYSARSSGQAGLPIARRCSQAVGPSRRAAETKGTTWAAEVRGSKTRARARKVCKPQKRQRRA